MSEAKFIEDKAKLCGLAPVAQAPLEHHVFVCNGKSCVAVGGAEVKAAFERELLAREMLYGKASKGKNPQGTVLLSDCSSIGFCAIGATVLVYPEGIWYAQVRDYDVAEIVQEHLCKGEIVERLALKTNIG